MIYQGLLLLCAVAFAQAFLKPVPIQPIFPIKPIVKKKFVPIVQKVRVPVYIEKEVRVPIYIDREYPVPVKVSGGVGGGAVAAGVGGGVDFGLDAKISDADTVNIQAGVGLGAAPSFDNNGLNDLNVLNDLGNDGQVGGGVQGLVGFDSQPPQHIDISQTSISNPSAIVSQPKLGHDGHGIDHKISPAGHHF